MKSNEQKYYSVSVRLFFITFVSLAISFSGCGEKQESQSRITGNATAQSATEVAVVTVTGKSVPVTLETTGKTESYREVEVRAQVSGTLLKRDYVEGSIVKKGNLLFQLDPIPFQTAVNQAKAMVSQQQAAVNKAERDIERLSPLLEEKAVSQKEYDDAVSSKELAQAALESAEAALEQAEINLNYTRVTAPISGITGKALKDEGSLISAGSDSLLTKIHQIDPIYVNYSTSDTEYLEMRRKIDEKTILVPDEDKFDVELTLSDGSIYPITGKLNYRDTLVDSQTGTIQNRAEFANPDSILMPNQFVRVTLKGAIRPETILVPQRAVQQNQAGHYVYTVNSEGKAEQRVVDVGDWIGDDWIIESGLSDGDVVVVDGTIKIQQGSQVRTAPEGDASTAFGESASSDR
ncbi:MAG: efflux RND transporter periplasmic adaptor subunit [Deltaproteobacteria bacterium]|nr:efflux RND transporter periplasmic adaptor subunit [Deltaproteobacteria bacterium]